MQRLNYRSWKILQAEINKLTDTDVLLGSVQQEIVLKRLNKLRNQKGKPASRLELEQLIKDIYPDFNDKIIAKAAAVNRPSSRLWLIPKVMVGTVAITGIVWLLNLPYPMIRRPVARTVPIVLLPSYISMDYHYRQTVKLVQQADQLITGATSRADIELGEKKVQQAQYHLDRLPVWFLGYEPQPLRGFYNYGWQFTLDEFEAARAKIARLEAVVFQAKNNWSNPTADQNLIAAAKEFAQAAAQSCQNPPHSVYKWQQCQDLWQEAIARLKLVKIEDSSYRAAQNLMATYQTNYSEIKIRYHNQADSERALEQAQRQLERLLVEFDPQTADQNRAYLMGQIQSIIDQLERVKPGTTVYPQAQELLKQAKAKLNQIK